MQQLPQIPEGYPRPSSTSYTHYSNSATFVPAEVFKAHDYWKELLPPWTLDADAMFTEKEGDNTDDSAFEKHLIVKDGYKRKYSAEIRTIRFENDDSKRNFYLLCEIPSKEELEALEPFCRCQRCRTFPIPFWFFICGCCVGCIIERYNTPDYIIKAARKHRAQRRGIPPPWFERYCYFWPVMIAICLMIFGSILQNYVAKTATIYAI